MRAPIESAVCRQCADPFRFIRRGKKPRVYCEVCQVLRRADAVKRFQSRMIESEKRLAIRANAILCHEAVA